MSSSLDFGFRKLKNIAGKRYCEKVFRASEENVKISQQIQSPFMTIKYTKRMKMENLKRTKF